MAYPNPKGVTWTIAINTSLSAAIQIGDKGVPVRIAFPAAWTAAVVTFQWSHDNSTFYELEDENGDAIVLVSSETAMESQGVKVDPNWFDGCNYIKVRSGTSGSAVNQAAARTGTVVMMPMTSRAGSRVTTPASTIADGADVTQGAIADAAVDGDALDTARWADDRYCFYDSAGTKLKHYQLTYGEGTGQVNFETWVLVPTLNGDANTATDDSIWVYFGYDGGAQSTVATWAAYTLVMPMEDDTTDATGKHNPTSTQAPTDYASGKVGKAEDFDSAGDFIRVPDADDLDGMDDLYVSFWVYHDAPMGHDSGTAARYICKDDYDETWSVVYGTDIEFWVSSEAGNIEDSATEIASGAWIHIACCRRRNTATGWRVYINGALDGGGQNATNVAVGANAADLYVGNNAAKNRTVDARIDELQMGRFAPGATNAAVDAWVKYEHANMNNADHEIAIAAKEDKPAAGGDGWRFMIHQRMRRQ